jgi:hypothetical protein
VILATTLCGQFNSLSTQLASPTHREHLKRFSSQQQCRKRIQLQIIKSIAAIKLKSHRVLSLCGLLPHLPNERNVNERIVYELTNLYPSIHPITGDNVAVLCLLAAFGTISLVGACAFCFRRKKTFEVNL